MHLQESTRPDVSSHQEKTHMLIPQSCGPSKSTDHPAHHFLELPPKPKRKANIGVSTCFFLNN